MTKLKAVEDLNVRKTMEKKIKVKSHKHQELKPRVAMAGKRKAETETVNNIPSKKGKHNYEHKIYVGRLNPISTIQSIKETFTKFGTVVDVYLPKNNTTPTNKGFAFVAFKEQSSVQEALKNSYIVIDKCKTKITEMEDKCGGISAAMKVPTLFIGNIGVHMQAETVRKHFENIGVIKSFVWPKTEGKKKSSSYAFVSYEDAKSVKKALSSKHEVNGCELTAAIRNEDLSPNNTENKYEENCLHIGNLEDAISKEALRKYFSQFGELTFVARPYDKKTKNWLDYGFVAYQSWAGVAAAVARPHTIGGVQLTVNYKPSDNRLSKIPHNDYCLCVSNCSPDTPLSVFKKHFTTYGALKFVNWHFNKEQDRKETFMYVAYKEEDGLTAALATRIHKIADDEVIVSARQSVVTPSHQPGCGVYVSKVPYVISKKDMQDYFARFGKIASFVMPYDSKLKQHKAHIFLQYEDAAIAHDVIAQSHQIKGASLLVEKMAKKKSKPKKES